MLNDPDMAVALEPIKEIHSIRLKIQDETVNMATTEKIEFLNKEAEAFLAPMGSLYIMIWLVKVNWIREWRLFDTPRTVSYNWEGLL
jgi:hypothetical protein